MKRKVLAGAAGLLIVLAVVLVWNRKTVGMVFDNLTSPKLALDESEEWEGGSGFLHIPYAMVSESDWLDLYVPDHEQGESLPLLVLVHGGGFISNDAQSRQTQWMYRYFRNHGFACAAVNYRLAQEAAYPAAIEDVKAAVRFLRVNAKTWDLDPERFAIWGESAGGYLASMAAVTNDEEFNSLPFIGEEDTAEPVSARVSALVDFYGCVDFRTMQDDIAEAGIPRFVYNIANSWLSGDVLEGYENVESFWLRRNLSAMAEEELEALVPILYAEKNREFLKDLKTWISHGTSDLTVPDLQSIRFAEQMTALFGSDSVVQSYKAHCGHADDRLYTDEELEKINVFLNG